MLSGSRHPKHARASSLRRVRHRVGKSTLFIRFKVQIIRIILDIVRSMGLGWRTRLHEARNTALPR